MSEKRPPIAEKFLSLVNAMNRHEGSSLPLFRPRFFRVNVSGDRALYLRADEDGIVRFTSAEGITSAILQYVHTELAGDEQCATWVASTADAAFRFWANFTRPIELPPSWCWIDDRTPLTFHRVPFYPTYPQDAHFARNCPMFAEMMARTSNSDALMAWIGSIFDPTSDLQQYVWIYGHGNDGKGSLARFLNKVLDTAAVWKQPPGLNDKFWTYSLLGKRLVIYGDCNQAGWVTSGPFKSMTGGDPVDLEQKFGASFSQKLTAKHLFLSNKRPTIEGDRADQRRIIYCEMEGIRDQSDSQYEEKLWAEAPRFLGVCQQAYARLDGQRIPVVVDNAELLASMNEEGMEYAAETYFKFSSSHSMSAMDFHREVRLIGMVQSRDQRKFYEYINRVHNVEKRRENTGDRHWFYSGLCPRISRQKFHDN